jgi:hypothetical protein
MLISVVKIEIHVVGGSHFVPNFLIYNFPFRSADEVKLVSSNKMNRDL